MAERKKREEVSEEEKGKGYTYEFYHDIGKKGGETRKSELGHEGYVELGHKGGEAVKRRHGHESLEEVRREHEEGKP